MTKGESSRSSCPFMPRILRRSGWVIVLLVIFSGTNLGDETRTSDECAGKPVESQFITVEGIRLHYVSQGVGQPVVLVHGNPGFLQDYAAIVADLASRNFRAVAFDRPGHGFSQRPAHQIATPEVQARLLHQALIKLGIRKPILVGHSWGGTLVLNYALQYPDEVSGIVLLAPAAYPEREGFSFQNLLVHVPVLSSIMIKALRPYIHNQIKGGLERAFAPAQVPKQYLTLALSCWARSTAIRATIADRQARQHRLREISNRYPTIHLPVVIVTGDADRIVDPVTDDYPLHEAIKDSRLLVLPHTGHEIPQMNPTAVLEAIQLVRQLVQANPLRATK